MAGGEELANSQEAKGGAGAEADLEEVLGVSEGHHAALLQL